MVSLKRPVVIRYALRTGTDRRGRPIYTSRNPDGSHVTKDTPGAVRFKDRAKIWHGSWRDAAGRPTPYTSLHTTDRDTAEQIARERERSALLGAEGLRDDRRADRLRPLAEHLEDYRRYLAAQGDVAQHVQETVRQCAAILDGCRFVLAADLDPDAVVEWLAELRTDHELPELVAESYSVAEVATIAGIQVDSVRLAIRRRALPAVQTVTGRREFVVSRQDLVAWLAQRPRHRGASIETSNHYLRAVKGFAAWLRKKVKSNPLEDLEALNAETDRRRVRRALTQEQVVRLLAAVRGVVAGLDAAARRLLYHTALRTGLRAGELASLTPRSLVLTAPFSVTVLAGYSKHRRQDVLPLRADLAAELQAYSAGRDPGAPLWPGSWPDEGAAMLRVDLAVAGIPERDEHGHVVDFHALRHTFVSQLVESGCPPKVAQMLARHSSITLTYDRYTHLNVMDAVKDLENLPSVSIDMANKPERA